MQRDEHLASATPLCRLESRADRKTAVQIHKIFEEQFICSFQKEPNELILDVDTTDNRIHGYQIGRSFHGYGSATIRL